MKQNQKNRFNARHNGRGASPRPQMIFRNTSLDSMGPAGKLRGTALQLVEKYQTAAKDALIQNDAILAETFQQYADHYMRVQNQAILNEESLRANNQKKAEPAESEKGETEKNEADEIPAFEALAENVEAKESSVETKAESVENTKESTAKSTDAMDLSVPVRAMQEKAPARRILRPKQKQTQEKAISEQ